jgi:archaemetzincin
MPEIHLIPIGLINRQILEFLALILPDAFHIPCLIREAEIDLEAAYSPERQQYHSTHLLAQLLSHSHGTSVKLLGVTQVDLYVPILTFVFGEAQLGKQCALISVHRLYQSFYGLPEDEALFYHRCEKEAIHELGHTCGLVHCHNFECVMYYANSVEDIDLKGNSFCEHCLSTPTEEDKR